jgi:aldose 1-epimerase
MYEHRIEPFGKFEKHILENKETGDSLAVVPQRGACLLSLKFSGKEVLDGYQTPEELEALDWGKSIVLFPFPNRLRDGKYTHDGKTYQFDCNNPETGNAIHGFGSETTMKLEKVGTYADWAYLHCTFEHDGITNPLHKAYPFRFSFQISFVFKRSTLGINMSITNRENDPIPVGLGWHPYFKTSENIGDVFLQLPKSQRISIDSRMLPTGEKLPFWDFQKLEKIGDKNFDTAFFLTDPDENNSAKVALIAENFGKLTYWQEMGTAKWNFLQVFTPPNRQSIALEPMTCNVDAFNNGDGLVLLPPDQTLGGIFGVGFEEIASLGI